MLRLSVSSCPVPAARGTSLWSCTVRYQWLALCLLLLTFLTGCARGPDEADVRDVVSERLRSAFHDPLLEIASLKRMGSASLAAGGDGAARMIVYYNARFTLERDYRFSDWDALNPAALASLLGATERGISGIQSTGNAAGDSLLVHGSVTFSKEDDGDWKPVLFVPPEAPDAVPVQDQASETARELVEPIMERFSVMPPSQAAASRAIIAEELQEAMRQIDLRLDNLQRVLVVAGGQPSGEYAVVAKEIATLGKPVGVRVAATTTEGSVQNAQLLRSHFATVGIVQSDVALMAFQGTGPFAAQGAAPSLRALGSLFPEAVQFVVRADGPTSVSALRGLKVDLGLPASGTRNTALAVLEAHGLRESDIQASDMGPVEAGQALARGEIDAFVTVISAPERQLQRLAADNAIRILSLSPEAVAMLARNSPGIVPIMLPAGTYPGQDTAVRTVGVAALLVATTSMSNAEVRRVLTGVYTGIDFVAAGSSAGAMISLRHALTGITIPLHSGAEAFFAETKASEVQTAQ
ncbi:TAXI family TRAP transporter solute-binding subunit [Bordetella sp. 15P40C-2]|nr:TAXI family TRAP transporter solute-binding subunit [Bordetella sp. 15P40C-2]